MLNPTFLTRCGLLSAVLALGLALNVVTSPVSARTVLSPTASDSIQPQSVKSGEIVLAKKNKKIKKTKMKNNKKFKNKKGKKKFKKKNKKKKVKKHKKHKNKKMKKKGFKKKKG